MAVVADLDAAIDHIARFGSGHSEAIVTGDLAAADRFTAEVDAAAVLVNASTRFVDGEELGLGAEIGISTQKLHARGPMGAAGTDQHQVRGARATGRCGHDRRRPTGPATATGSARPPVPAPLRLASTRCARGLAGVDYLADEGIAGVVYLADRLAKPVLVEGPAGHGQDRAGQVGGPS